MVDRLKIPAQQSVLYNAQSSFLHVIYLGGAPIQVIDGDKLLATLDYWLESYTTSFSPTEKNYELRNVGNKEAEALVIRFIIV